MERVGPAKHCRTDGDELSSWTSQLDSLSFTGSQRAEVVYTNTHILPLYYTDYTVLALSTVNYKELGEPAYERIGNNRPKVVKVVTLVTVSLLSISTTTRQQWLSKHCAKSQCDNIIAGRDMNFL